MSDKIKSAALALAGLLAVAIGVARAPRAEQFAGFTGFSPVNVGTTGIGGSVALASAPAAGQSVTGATLASGTLTLTYGVPLWNDYTGKVVQWSEEFCGAPTNANNGTWGIFTTSQASPGAASTSIGASTRPCIAKWTTGAGASGRESLFTNLKGLALGGGAWSIHYVFGTEQLSNATDEYSLFIGLGDTLASNNQANAVGFVYDRSNGLTNDTNTGNLSNWECYAAAGSARTIYVMHTGVTTDGAFAAIEQAIGAYSQPSTNIYNLDIEVNAAGTEADFLVNGVKSCVITTHLPTLGMGFLVNPLNSAGTGAGRVFDLDTFWAVNTLTAARSP